MQLSRGVTGFASGAWPYLAGTHAHRQPMRGDPVPRPFRTRGPRLFDWGSPSRSRLIGGLARRVSRVFI